MGRPSFTLGQKPFPIALRFGGSHYSDKFELLIFEKVSVGKLCVVWSGITIFSTAKQSKVTDKSQFNERKLKFDTFQSGFPGNWNRSSLLEMLTTR